MPKMMYNGMEYSGLTEPPVNLQLGVPVLTSATSEFGPDAKTITSTQTVSLEEGWYVVNMEATGSSNLYLRLNDVILLRCSSGYKDWHLLYLAGNEYKCELNNGTITIQKLSETDARNISQQLSQVEIDAGDQEFSAEGWTEQSPPNQKLTLKDFLREFRKTVNNLFWLKDHSSGQFVMDKVVTFPANKIPVVLFNLDGSSSCGGFTKDTITKMSVMIVPNDTYPDTISNPLIFLRNNADVAILNGVDNQNSYTLNVRICLE